MNSLCRLVVAAMLCLCALPGCTSQPLVPPHDAGSPTGGLGLRLWYAQIESRQYQLFEVDRDGSFRYGGGMVAFNRHTDWAGTLTPDEARAIRTMVDDAGWLTAEKPSQTTADTPLAELALYADGKTRNVEIRGPDPRVTAFVDALQKIANQRFERFLQRLPEAGSQTR